MRNLTKNSVANVAKVGVASALIGAGLFLSACGGGDEFKPSSEAEKKVVNLIKNKSADAKILSFSVAQKEFGLKDRECLKNVKDINGYETYVNGFMYDYLFIKLSNGEIQVREVSINDKTNGGILTNAIYTLEQIKAKKPECFN